MSNTFQGCSSLRSLDLSNWNTEKVQDMHSLFEGCTSLKFLHISNFNMINCIKYDDMFKNVEYIKFINIYNLQNDKTIGDIFNQKRNEVFYYCQSINIIHNPMAVNCCDYIISNDTCDIPDILTLTTDEQVPDFISTYIFDKSILEKFEEEINENEYDEEEVGKRERISERKRIRKRDGKTARKKGR